MVKTLRRSGNGLAGQHSGANDRDGHQAVLRSAITQEAGGSVTPGDQTIIRPAQHQIVAVAAVVVGHEVVPQAAVGERHFLALRQVAEGTGYEGETRIFHNGQHGSRRRRVVQR